MMKSPESNSKKIIIDNGNVNDSTNIQGDYNHCQNHGDSNDLSNQTKVIINQFNRSIDSIDFTDSKRTTCVIELDGNLADILLDPSKRESFLQGLDLLRKIDPTLQMRDIKEGSIKITLEGSEEKINQILDQISAGEFDMIGTYSIVSALKIEDTSKAEKKVALVGSTNHSKNIQVAKSKDIKYSPQVNTARVVSILDGEEAAFLIRIRGRVVAAEAFYDGSEHLMKVGDRVIVLGTRGANLLVIPNDERTIFK